MRRSSPRRRVCDFTGLCLMAKGRTSQDDSESDSDSDVNDDSTSSVKKLERALRSQDKLLKSVFHENKDLNVRLENSLVEIATFRSMHDDMSAPPCEDCNMIIVAYSDLMRAYSQVASQLKGTMLVLKELKTRPSLLGSCINCPMLKSNLVACNSEIKELKHKLDHHSCYMVLSPPCECCGTLKGKLLHATKENSDLE